MATIEDYQFAAHLLRRTSFHVTRAEVEAAASAAKQDREALIRKLVDSAQPPNISKNPGLQNRADKFKSEDFKRMVLAEIQRLNSPKSGLGDRMLWFWHGFLTSGMAKVGSPGLLWRQHRLIAKHALGSFRDLLIELTLDPAMLIYLDGNHSRGNEGSIPNENYARELLELFSLGRVDEGNRGNYSQADVTAAARGLAGWYIANPPRKGKYDPARVKVRFDLERAFAESIPFLGKTLDFAHISDGVERVTVIVDQILASPVAARFIVRKLFVHFVHASPDADTIDSLAATFRSNGYQILPVLQQLFRLPAFTSPEAMSGRARLPMEWLIATLSALGLSARRLDCMAFFHATAQTPFNPADVSGWAVDDRWLSVSQAVARARLATAAFQLPKRNRLLKQLSEADQQADEVLETLSLFGDQVSAQTRAQVENLLTHIKTKAFDEKLGPTRSALALALSCPEFSLT